jgi:hypothetical protein
MIKPMIHFIMESLNIYGRGVTSAIMALGKGTFLVSSLDGEFINNPYNGLYLNRFFS